MSLERQGTCTARFRTSFSPRGSRPVDDDGDNDGRSVHAAHAVVEYECGCVRSRHRGTANRNMWPPGTRGERHTTRRCGPRRRRAGKDRVNCLRLAVVVLGAVGAVEAGPRSNRSTARAARPGTWFLRRRTAGTTTAAGRATEDGTRTLRRPGAQGHAGTHMTLE